ncbi:MAG: hypothetical protein ACW98J_03285 [Candidatus Thorarchaeota archaeon]|jgi:hypothetical protein
MERSIESERTRIGFGGLEESDSEAASEAPLQIRTESQFLDAARIYAKPLGGITAMLALLALPALTLPGLAIFTLIGEIYLIDWTYSKLSDARSGGTELADTKALQKDASPENEIDKIAARTGPKDQFIR